MLFSLSLIFLVGLLASYFCSLIKLPRLFGMILTGILLGPCVLNAIDSSILNISAELRKIALIIILTRAGLTLQIQDLKKVGRPAFLMCFLPATFELIGMILIAPKLFNLTLLESALLGTVIAAVSPAVIVPKMIKLIENGYGTKAGIPQLILAGASVDDVFVIVLFSAFLSLAQGQEVLALQFVNIPVSIILGIAIGFFVGWFLSIIFHKFHIRDTIKVLIFLSISFLLVTMEDAITIPITFSALISIMFIGIGLQKSKPEVSKRLSVKFNKLWVGAEILLFVLVGATVELSYVTKAGIRAVILIFGVLLFRTVGVWLCLLLTSITYKERLFCIIGYLPKATVQTAIGSIPLTLQLPCGNIVLTIAVLAILITAPLGSFLIDLTYKKLLTK